MSQECNYNPIYYTCRPVLYFNIDCYKTAKTGYAYMSEIGFDALLPQEMATRAEYLGVRKAEMPFLKMFMLSVLAGAFIALGAIFATTVSAGGMAITTAAGDAAFSTSLPFGVTRLLAGLVFSLGLILVVVGGAELFSGYNLILLASAS